MCSKALLVFGLFSTFSCELRAQVQFTSRDEIVGTWTTKRPSTWQFLYDGTLLYSRDGVVSEGSWKRSGDRVLIGQMKDGVLETKQWFRILSNETDVLRIEMHEKEVRDDTWTRSEDVVIGSWVTPAPSEWQFQPDGTLIYRKANRASESNWKRDGKRILIGTKKSDGTFETKQWFLVKERRKDSIEIEMHGIEVRDDTWKLKLAEPTSSWFDQD